MQRTDCSAARSLVGCPPFRGVINPIRSNAAVSLALAAEPVSLEGTDTPVRWLELRKLVETLFPRDSINRVCYFTTRLDACHGNPSQR